MTSKIMKIAMWRRLFAMPVLLISIALSILFWIGESLFHYLVFDPVHPFEIVPSDQNELWMRLLICGVIIIFGAYIQRQSFRKRAVEEEKLRTLKATMHTVEDSVGNTLLSIKYLLLAAEKQQHINLQTSKDIVNLIDDCMYQLREIGNLGVASETEFTNNTFYLNTDKKNNIYSI